MDEYATGANERTNTPKIGKTIRILAVAYFLTLITCVHLSGFEITPPHIHSGDEPHYIIMLDSLIRDHDLALQNNYQDFRFYYRNGTGQPHESYIEINGTIREIPSHSIGLPAVAAAFLWPFRSDSIIEAGAVTLNAVISLLLLLMIYKILLYHFKDPDLAANTTLYFGLGTFLWHYSKTFFSEPLTGLILAGAYYLSIQQKTHSKFMVGLLLGFGTLVKYTFFIFLPIFALLFLVRKEFGHLTKFMIGLIIGLIPLGAYQMHLFGTIFQPTYLNTVWQIPLKGTVGLLVSPAHGLLTYAPVLIFAILGISTLLRSKNKQEYYLAGSISLAYFLLIASWISWEGGFSYSARLLYPIVPLLAIPLAAWLKENKGTKEYQYFRIMLAISILINFLAAEFHIGFWAENQWIPDVLPKALEYGAKTISSHFGLQF